MTRYLMLLVIILSPLTAQYAWFTTGEQRTIVAVVGLGFQPSQADVDRARTAVFGVDTSSIDSFIRAASHNQTWFVGDAIGVSIPLDSSCQVWGSTMQTVDNVVGQRVDLNLYTRRVYVLLGNSGCGFAGISTAGITFRYNDRLYSLLWVVGFQSARIWQHEMGHSLGLSHAHTDDPRTNQGDPSDIMGVGGHTFNGPHKTHLQWLAASQIQEVTQDGAYVITPLETSVGLKILKIPRPVVDTPGWNESLYISYRQPVGFYNTSMNSGLTDGVSVHLVAELFPALHGYLIDATPNSSLFFHDAAIKDNGCIYDASNRILIRQLSHTVGTNGSATVTVTRNVNDPGCTAAPPPPPPPPPPSPCPNGYKGNSGKCR